MTQAAPTARGPLHCELWNVELGRVNMKTMLESFSFKETTHRNETAPASCTSNLENKEGKIIQYLRLLHTVSVCSLIFEEIVKKHKLKVKKYKRV